MEMKNIHQWAKYWKQVKMLKQTLFLVKMEKQSEICILTFETYEYKYVNIIVHGERSGVRLSWPRGEARAAHTPIESRKPFFSWYINKPYCWK